MIVWCSGDAGGALLEEQLSACIYVYDLSVVERCHGFSAGNFWGKRVRLVVGLSSLADKMGPAREADHAARALLFQENSWQ